MNLDLEYDRTAGTNIHLAPVWSQRKISLKRAEFRISKSPDPEEIVLMTQIKPYLK